MAITWTADLANNARDQVFFFGLLLQVIAFGLLLWNLTIVTPHWRKSRTSFWNASLAGSVFLLATPIFEVAFVLSRFTSGTLWPFPSYMTSVGDLIGRSAYVCITICRFYRLRIVAPVRRETARRIFLAASGIVAIVNLSAIIASFHVHIAEASAGITPRGKASPEVIALRGRDRLVSFIAFSITTILSLCTDYLFVKVLILAQIKAHGDLVVPRNVKLEVLAPYLPAVAIAFSYALCLQLSFFAPTLPSIQFITITMGKAIPTIDAVIFFRFSINQTRTLLSSLISSAGASRSLESQQRTFATTATSTNPMMSRIDPQPTGTFPPQWKPPFQADTSFMADDQRGRQHYSHKNSHPPQPEMYVRATPPPLRSTSRTRQIATPVELWLDNSNGTSHSPTAPRTEDPSY